MNNEDRTPARDALPRKATSRKPASVPTHDAAVRAKRLAVSETRPPWVEKEDDTAQSKDKLWGVVAAALVVSLLLPKTRRVVAPALLLLLSAAYYLAFVFNFVPSKKWSEVSIGVGLLAAILVTIPLMTRRSRMLAGHSVTRTMIAIVTAFGMSWWIAYLVNNYIVGDVVTRLTGQPASMSERVVNTDSYRRWHCRPRLAGKAIGRGKCISRQLHRLLPRTVEVTVQAHQSWAGYAIDDIIVDPAKQQSNVAQ